MKDFIFIRYITVTYLKKSDIILNWSVYSLFGVAIFALVSKYLLNYPNFDLPATILAILGVIAISMARHSIQVNNLDQKLIQTNEELIQTKKSMANAETNLKTLFERSKNATILKPSNLSDYIEAWSGFTGVYRAFNPSFSMEVQAGRNAVIAAVFVERFKDKNFVDSLYLFYTSTNSLHQLYEFRKLMKDVMKIVGWKSINGRLKIKKMPGEAPMYEFYSGEKGSIQTAIVDFWASPPEKRYQLSDYVLLFHYEDVINSLNQTFMNNWNDPKNEEVDINKFLNTDEPV